MTASERSLLSGAAASGTSWADDATARAWAAGDGLGDLLELPRRLAVAVAAADLGEVTRIVDIGSGPGEFLAVALERSPAAEGIWTDASPAMESMARARLAGFGDRVRFVRADLADLRRVTPGRSADLIISSRVTHHLSDAALAAFYRDAAVTLRPGGWIANLDHILLDEPWAARLGLARAEFAAANRSGHRHVHPLPTVAQHLDALAAAGLTDTDVPWRAFWSVLILTKKPILEEGRSR